MLNTFENLKLDIFGESHAPEIGVRLSGIKKGEIIDLDELQAFVDRRKSTASPWSTPRLEEDKIVIISGIENGVATGETIEAIIKNKAQHSSDYNDLKYTPRPSHADYVCAIKDKTGVCPSGGGRFSGRMTAALCIAGGIAKQILAKNGIKVLSYIRSIGDITGDNFSCSDVDETRIENIDTKLKALTRANDMVEAVKKAASEGDSLGGIIDCIAFGVPLGIGDNLYSGLEGRISQSVFAVPAVKGVSFGDGFKLAEMLGSEANDVFAIEDGKIITETNRSGGINGGISNGMPITLSVAFRPTPSIFKPQKTVDLSTMSETVIQIKGRHDACVAVRGSVAVEAAVALSLVDALMDK